MFIVKEEYEGKSMSFALGNRVSENELQTMRVLEALMVKKGGKIVAIAGKVENNSRLHYPIIYFSPAPTFYCGGEIPEELRGVLGGVASDCWRQRERVKEETSPRSLGCKHAFVLLQAIKSCSIVPQVIEEPEDESDDLLEDLKLTAFRVHLLLWGEPGSGKTWTAFRVAEEVAAKEKAETIVVQGGPAVEAVDLLGMWVKRGNEVVWQDGPLMKAFRFAAGGRKVIVIIDELPRIQPREQNILVAPLLPTPRGLILYNPLNGEEVVAPQGNLWCIATGNLGEGFAGRLVDGALMERFLMLEVKTSTEKLRGILSRKLQEKGWDTNIVEKMLALRQASEELVARGELPAAPSLRVLLRAIELAPSSEELPKWVALCHSQVALSEGRELWEKLVKKVLG